MTAFQARGIRGHVDWCRAITMLAGAAMVLPFSVTAMLAFGADTARLAVSAIVLVMSLILLSGWTLTRVIGPTGHTMIVYLTGLDLITLPFLWHGGLVTMDTPIAVAFAFPLLALGVWLGGRQFLSASPSTFRRFAVILLLILSLLGLLRAIL